MSLTRQESRLRLHGLRNAVSTEMWRRGQFARLLLTPLVAAASYPLLLSFFHVWAISRGPLAVPVSALLLLLAIGAPMSGIYVYWKLNSTDSPSPIEIRAKVLALIS